MPRPKKVVAVEAQSLEQQPQWQAFLSAVAGGSTVGVPCAEFIKSQGRPKGVPLTADMPLVPHLLVRLTFPTTRLYNGEDLQRMSKTVELFLGSLKVLLKGRPPELIKSLRQKGYQKLKVELVDYRHVKGKPPRYPISIVGELQV